MNYTFVFVLIEASAESDETSERDQQSERDEPSESDEPSETDEPSGSDEPSESNGISCCICQDVLNLGTKRTLQLPCSHRFCTNCIIPLKKYVMAIVQFVEKVGMANRLTTSFLISITKKN